MSKYLQDPMGPPVKSDIKPGEVYEDSAFHPCLCLGIDEDVGMAWGISLIDGSYPRQTDLYLGGIRRLTLEQAWQWKQLGPEAVGKAWNEEFGLED